MKQRGASNVVESLCTEHEAVKGWRKEEKKPPPRPILPQNQPYPLLPITSLLGFWSSLTILDRVCKVILRSNTAECLENLAAISTAPTLRSGSVHAESG